MNLLGRLNCKTILSPTPHPPQITAILEANAELQVLEVPSVDELLNKKYQHFPFKKTFSEARQEPFVIV